MQQAHFSRLVCRLHHYCIDITPDLDYNAHAMSENLLRPNAEVVRTGLPNPSLEANPPTLSPSGAKLVAGPFALHPPDQSPIPPNSYTQHMPTAAPEGAGSVGAKRPPERVSQSHVSHVHGLGSVTVSVEDEDELRYIGSPIPDPSLGALGPAKGGKKPRKAILWEVIRSLRPPSVTPSGDTDPGDLPLLSQSLPAARQNLTQIRHSHHQLAQMLATGTKQEECALITGYSPVYISILKGDPAFKDLISYYSAQREVIFVDAIERMRSLGLSTLDELQARLEEDPSQFTNRELFEQAELTLVKPMAATRGVIPLGGPRAPDGSASGVQVNVNFIQTAHKGDTPLQPDIIDMKPSPKL